MVRCTRAAAQGYGAVRDQPSLLVSFSCVWGAAEGQQEGQKPPSPKGVNPRSRRTRLSADLPGAGAEKVPSTSALSPSHPADRVGCGVSIHARASPALLGHQTG